MNQARNNLIQLLMQLEGVGQKTAERFANQIVQKQNQELLQDFAGSLIKLSFCPLCDTIMNDSSCQNCAKMKAEQVLSIPLYFNPEIAYGQFPIGKLINPLKNNYPQTEWMDKLNQLIITNNIQKVVFELPQNLSGNLTREYLKEEINQPDLFKE